MVEGDIVKSISGKYEGQIGTVSKINGKTLKLLIGDTETGNVPWNSVEKVVQQSTPPPSDNEENNPDPTRPVIVHARSTGGNRLFKTSVFAMTFMMGMSSMQGVKPWITANSFEEHLSASMFTVKGKPVHGLIVDPGAARGLTGIDTLRTYNRDVLQPNGISYTIEQSDGTFSGIGGDAQPAAGALWLPIGLEGVGLVLWTGYLILLSLLRLK